MNLTLNKIPLDLSKLNDEIEATKHRLNRLTIVRENMNDPAMLGLVGLQLPAGEHWTASDDSGAKVINLSAGTEPVPSGLPGMAQRERRKTRGARGNAADTTREFFQSRQNKPATKAEIQTATGYSASAVNNLLSTNEYTKDGMDGKATLWRLKRFAAK